MTPIETQPRFVKAGAVRERYPDIFANDQVVYRLAAENVLPCIRLGRAVWFDLEQVEEFFRSGGRALPGGWRRAPRTEAA